MSPSRAASSQRSLWGRFDPYILLVLLFSLFTIGPLLQPGYMWDAHDARHSVYFLFEFDQGIRDGILYPRWQPDFAFGYGYPFFNIYGPLASYLGEAFRLLGWDFVAAVKMVFALSVVCSGLAMYGFAKQILGRRGGLVAAVAYMVIPYRLVDLYVRPPWPNRWPMSLCRWSCGACGPRCTARAWSTSPGWRSPTPP